MTYLQLDATEGKLFEYSKEEKEGFKKHVSTKGNESFRKYFDKGVEGNLQKVELKDGLFGRVLDLVVENNSETYTITFSLLNQKGGLDNFVETIIKVLPNLSKEDFISVSPYAFIPEGKDKKLRGVSIKKDGLKVDKLSQAYINKDGSKTDGDIPAIVWKKSASGVEKPTAVSLEAREEYLFEVLNQAITRIGGGTTTKKEQTQKADKTQPIDTSSYKEVEEDDDLPF